MTVRRARLKILRLAFSAAAAVGLSTAIIVGTVSIGHAMMLTEWLNSRNASPGDPSYQPTYQIRNDSITNFLVSAAVIGLWIIVWAMWRRRAFRSGARSSSRR